MKFSELKQQDIDFILEVHRQEKSLQRDTKLANYFGIDPTTVRKWLKRLEISEPNKIDPESIEFAKSRQIPKAKRYLITAAQNETPVHLQLWENMQAFAKDIKAEILVIPYRYKNPTSVFSDFQHDDWDSILHQNLIQQRFELNDNLVLLADAKVQPTATNPLTGFESITGHRSAIIGHSSLCCKSIPVIAGDPVKGLYTTGACTLPNYTDSKAGKIGEFHHVLGFCVVEIVDKSHFFCRNVSADNEGNFIDLLTAYEFGEKIQLNEIESLVLGDFHAFVASKKRLDNIFAQCNKLNPKTLVLHDIADGYTVNPHESNNHVLQVKKAMQGKNIISNELNHLKELLGKIKDNFSGAKIYVVKSNHDEFFDRYVDSCCWKKDYINASTYLELAQIAIKSDNGIIPYLVSSWHPEIECLKYNQSKKIKGIEISLHGHSGNNGAKGSANQFRQLCTKIITAHNHGFVIADGLYQVGTCTDRFQAYNKGASGAAWADCIIHKNGKRQLLVWSDNRFSELV